ncbi:hypothetical protein [Marinobacter salicampi]|uniref:hypothetical protein n=1 Tax=Marinobacter salicampi TaxID=435907 RepID=UPI0014098FC8|nr:hypothetical protein [Marinobacter salicampi]
MHAPELILPISDLQINTLVKWRRDRDQVAISEKIEEWAQHAPIEALISAVLIQQVPLILKQGKPVPASLEKVLASLLASVKGIDEEEALRQAIPQQIDLDTFAEGARELGPNSVDVLRQSELDSDPFADATDFRTIIGRQSEPMPDFIDDEGNWDFTFTSRQHARRNPFTREMPIAGGNTLKLTDPQFRFYQKFKSEPDESLNLMSYFGGGKTFLAKHMLAELSEFPEFVPVVLALTKAQLGGLMKRLDAPETQARTFGQMASEIMASQSLPAHWRPGKRRDPNYMLSFGEIARRLQIGPVGTLSPDVVADIASKAVRSFCQSGQPQLQLRHLPTVRDNLTDLDRLQLVQYAQELWDETTEPADLDSQLPVRAYHLIKYCALRGFTVPERYTHVLIDEGHDLTTPMTQLLDNSPQAIQTMGDPHQRLRGFVPRRKAAVRQSEIGLTVRASNQVERIFNTLIERHPAQTRVILQGARHMRTRISYYDPERPPIPRQKTTVLVSDLFELTEWFHRLREAKVPFSLLSGSTYDFYNFNASLIGLFFQGKRGQSPALFRYPNWEALAADRGSSRAFARVEAMLSGSKDRQNELSQALEVVTTPEKATILLGLAEHARNTEFDRVMLAPDLLMDKNRIFSASVQAHVLSMIYIGASRARYELLLPGHLKEWLEQQQALEPDFDFE